LPSPLKHGAFDVSVRESLEGHATSSHALIPLLDARLVPYQTYLKLNNQAKALVREDSVCQRLMTVPGVGAITALTFKAGDPDVRSALYVAAHSLVVRSAEWSSLPPRLSP